MTKQEIQKFENLNDKVRAEEIRLRERGLLLYKKLKQEKDQKLIDDFEIEVEFSVFSYNEEFCKSKNVEVGDPFCDSRYLGYILNLRNEDDDFFFMNGNEFSGSDNDLAHLHFGHLMHCLVFHSDLSFDDLLAIDDVWLELKVRYQFFTDKPVNQ